MPITNARPTASATAAAPSEETSQEKEKETEGEGAREPVEPKESSPAKPDEVVDEFEATAPSVAGKVLSKSIYVFWPHLREALVLGVSDAKCRVSQVQGIVPHSPEDAAAWHKEAKYQLTKHKSKKGIDLGERRPVLPHWATNQSILSQATSRCCYMCRF